MRSFLRLVASVVIAACSLHITYGNLDPSHRSAAAPRTPSLSKPSSPLAYLQRGGFPRLILRGGQGSEGGGGERGTADAEGVASLRDAIRDLKREHGGEGGVGAGGVEGAAIGGQASGDSHTPSLNAQPHHEASQGHTPSTQPMAQPMDSLKAVLAEARAPLNPSTHDESKEAKQQQEQAGAGSGGQSPQKASNSGGADGVVHAEGNQGTGSGAREREDGEGVSATLAPVTASTAAGGWAGGAGVAVSGAGAGEILGGVAGVSMVRTESLSSSMEVLNNEVEALSQQIKDKEARDKDMVSIKHSQQQQQQVQQDGGMVDASVGHAGVGKEGGVVLREAANGGVSVAAARAAAAVTATAAATSGKAGSAVASVAAAADTAHTHTTSTPPPPSGSTAVPAGAAPPAAAATSAATAAAAAAATAPTAPKSSGGQKDDKSRFAFPVEMLVEKSSKEGQAPAEDSTTQWESIVMELERGMQLELEEHPNNMTGLLDYSRFLSMVLEDEDWVSKTDAMFEAALEHDPKHVETLFRYANFVYEFKSGYQEASDLYHRLLQHEPYHCLGLANLATIQHTINENFVEAESLYSQSLDFRPSLTNYYTVAYHTSRNTSRIALPSHLDYAGVLYNFGAFQHEVKRNLSVAKQLYSLSLQYNPNSTATLNNMGSVLAVQKEYENADAMYKRATMLDPYDAVTWHNYGVLAIERGRLDKATEYFNRVLKIDPFHIPTCLTYGRMLLETKCDLDGAERMCKRVLRRNPGQVHALVGYAQVAQVRGDTAMAEEMYARATDFHERNVAALIHKALYLELSAKDLAAADELYGKAQKLDEAKARELHDRLLPRHAVVVKLAAAYQARKLREDGKQKRFVLPQWAGDIARKLQSFLTPTSSSLTSSLFATCFGSHSPDTSPAAAHPNETISSVAPPSSQPTALAQHVSSSSPSAAPATALTGQAAAPATSAVPSADMQAVVGSTSATLSGTSTTLSGVSTPRVLEPVGGVGQDVAEESGQGHDGEGEGVRMSRSMLRDDEDAEILYDASIDEQVAGARTWDDIRNVTYEYLRRFKDGGIEDEGQRQAIKAFEGFDESLDEAEEDEEYAGDGEAEVGGQAAEPDLDEEGRDEEEGESGKGSEEEAESGDGSSGEDDDEDGDSEECEGSDGGDSEQCEDKDPLHGNVLSKGASVVDSSDVGVEGSRSKSRDANFQVYDGSGESWDDVPTRGDGEEEEEWPQDAGLIRPSVRGRQMSGEGLVRATSATRQESPEAGGKAGEGSVQAAKDDEGKSVGGEGDWRDALKAARLEEADDKGGGGAGGGA